MKNEIKHLSHSTYRCQYHIVFAPRYRRKVIYGQLKADIGQILRKLCEQKGVEILEANAMPDHIHMLVSIPLVMICKKTYPSTAAIQPKLLTFPVIPFSPSQNNTLINMLSIILASAVCSGSYKRQKAPLP